MTKKQKQAKKATKNSKRTKVVAQSDDEPDTANTFLQGEVPQAIATPESEVAVESEQAEALSAEAAGSETVPKTTRSDVAKANIKEGLKQHVLAGRPTKAELILVFGKRVTQ